MPTIIDELAMTLNLDPKGFEEGAQQAQTAASNLLQRILASLQQIEQKTAETAANTTRTQKTAADAAREAADKAARDQEDAARRAARAQEDEAKRAARTQADEAKKASQEQKKAAEQAAEAYHKTANAIRRVGTELLAMLGISLTVSAVERLFSGINKANVEAGYLARNIGMNVEQLTMWENIAGRLGGTSEGVAQAFRYVSQQQAKIKYEGTSELVPVVRDLFGVDVRGPDHRLLEGDALIEALRRGARRKGMSAVDIQYATERAGLGGLAPMVQATDEDYERAKRLRRESGNFTTEADSKAAKQLSNDLDELTQKAMGLAREFWRGLGPAIDDVVKRIIKWVDQNKDWLTEAAIDWGRRLGRAIVQLAEDFKTLMEGGEVGGFIGDVVALAKGANEAAKAMGGWGEAIKLLAEIWLGSRVLGMIASMARLAAAITAIGAGGAAAVEALAALVGVAIGNKMGQEDIKKRAEQLGYTYHPGGWLTDPYFTDREGKKVEWGEVLRREGYDPATGQTMGQSFGFGRPPRPGAAGGPPAAPSDMPTVVVRPPRTPADADAGATGTDLSGGVGATQEQTNAFRSVLGLRESGGRYNIMGGSSGRFAGKYQMGRAEINETAQRLGETPPSTEQFLHDPAMQERYFANYTLDHHRRLMKDPIYAKMSPDEQLAQLATAHLKGVGGALAQLHGGSAGVDAFKTSGASYRDMIQAEMRRLRHNAPATEVASAPPVLPARVAETVPSHVAQIVPQRVAETVPSRVAPNEPPLPEALRPRLKPSPAALATLEGSQPGAAGTTLEGSNAARRDQWATTLPEPVGAATAAQGFQMNYGDSSTDQSQTNTTHIGTMHVHSAADDAAGIAKDIHAELRRYDYARQADVGLA